MSVRDARNRIDLGLARLAMGRRHDDGPIARDRYLEGPGLMFADDIDPRDAYDVRCGYCGLVISATEILAFRCPMPCPRCGNRWSWGAEPTRDGRRRRLR